MTEKTNHCWWQNAVGYQIYPKSFYDTNGDGIGDIDGIIAKLPYLKDLGIDFIWLNPIYPSPNVDNGYDISDFKDVAAPFGDLTRLKTLLDKAHALGIKVLMDLVINHTSDQHPWFIEAKKSKDNPYRDYYHWVDCSKKELPNDWKSFFGGSVWEYDSVSEQAYFHLFYKEQPDLNWHNPQMRQEIYEMIRFWLKFGIDGFRLDAISHLEKAPWDTKIVDNPWAPFMNVSGIEVYMQELKAIFDEYQILTVGEASGVTSKKAREWTDISTGYLTMIFELEHNIRVGHVGHQRIDVRGFKQVLARWQKDLMDVGWNALYVENHDNPRINSVLGNETEKSAKAIAMMYLGLKGTPFIYQGQELGMVNFPFKTIDEMDDLSDKARFKQLIAAGSTPKAALKEVSWYSRDNARVPVSWENKANSGFTSGVPWLDVRPNCSRINVADEAVDPNSVLNFYKRLIALRKSKRIFSQGDFRLLLAGDENVFSYLRSNKNEQLFILVNLSGQKVNITLPNRVINHHWQCIVSNTQSINLMRHIELKGYDGFIFERIDKKSSS
ncbi:MAG: alpha-glucosidase [Streptococcaceae bacterium]|jgi:alpha-glucosidase|nr:alpha-glucosidase [Streptococcaceae bacterium]